MIELLNAFGMNNNNTSASMAQQILSNNVAKGFRSLFYLFTPNETSYPSLEEVPKFVDKAPPYFVSLIAIEFIILHLKGDKSKLPRWNDAFSSVAAGVVSQLPLLVMRNMELMFYTEMHDKYCLFELPWNSTWTWILALLGVDLGYYWVHRCAHEINFMWAGHQTHHSSEDYNLTTALRQGIFQRYSSWIFYLPMAFFIPPSVFYVHIQFNLLYQFWIHTQLIDKLPGPLEYILNTASHHRVHHGINRYCIDKNYAGVFIIWDRMFGTFEAERKMDEIAYGLVHQVNSWNPIYVQIQHWMNIGKAVWQMDGFSNKLSVLLKGPGWQPGKPRLGCIEDIPDAQAPVVKYDKSVCGRLTAYCMLQYLLAVIFYESLVTHKQVLPTSTLWIGAIFVIWSVTTIGFTFESRPYAKLSELTRWVTFLVLQLNWCSGQASNTHQCPPTFTFMKYAAILSIAITMARIIKQYMSAGQSTKKIHSD